MYANASLCKVIAFLLLPQSSLFHRFSRSKKSTGNVTASSISNRLPRRRIAWSYRPFRIQPKSEPGLSLAIARVPMNRRHPNGTL
jgi:hypothetical protein